MCAACRRRTVPKTKTSRHTQQYAYMKKKKPGGVGGHVFASTTCWCCHNVHEFLFLMFVVAISIVQVPTSPLGGINSAPAPDKPRLKRKRAHLGSHGERPGRRLSLRLFLWSLHRLHQRLRLVRVCVVAARYSRLRAAVKAGEHVQGGLLRPLRAQHKLWHDLTQLGKGVQ